MVLSIFLNFYLILFIIQLLYDKIKKGSTPLLIACLFSILSLFTSSPVKADVLVATQYNRTFYFSYAEPHYFTARAYAWQDHQIDSFLWLYNDSTNQLLTQNDDYYGLDSFISYNMEPNVQYRMVAGVCCGDPSRWYRESYEISVDGTPIQPSTTSSSSTTTTTEPPTTTTSTTTTDRKSTRLNSSHMSESRMPSSA